MLVWMLTAMLAMVGTVHGSPASDRDHHGEHVEQGEDADCPPCDKERLLRIAPADFEAVIVINNGARQRRSSAGRAFERMLSDIDAVPETRAAWRELAQTLDWPVERTFDELMGRRVTLVMRGLDDPQRTQWVVLSEVSAATERRLRERLRPAPRGHIAGLMSLSVESGRYELVVGPSGIASGMRPGDAGTMILLGRGGDSRLMGELAPMLLRPMPAPPSAPNGRECDFVVVLRQAQDRADAGHFLLLTGTMDDTGWDVSLAASPGMVWEQPQRFEKIRPWSDRAFRALESDALLAVMGVIGSTRLEGLSAVHALSGLLPVIPFTLEGEPFGQRAALYVREGRPPLHATATAGMAARTDAPVSMMRTVPRAGEFAGAVAKPASRLTVGLAIEATDTRAMMIEGDQMIARLMRFLESGDEPMSQSPRVQLVVTVPEHEVRALRLDGMFPINAAIAGGVRRAFGDEPVVSWGIRALAPGAARDAAGPRPGWWVAALSPGDVPVVARDSAALATSGGGRLLPRLSVGIIRPNALEQAMHRVDPGFLVPLRAMRWIEVVRWDAWQRDDGTIEAKIRVGMQLGPQ
jgi:hypothetical protein